MEIFFFWLRNYPWKVQNSVSFSVGSTHPIGDVHGDLEKSKQALQLAELINDSGNWTGGSTTVVQVSDVLERGGD